MTTSKKQAEKVSSEQGWSEMQGADVLLQEMAVAVFTVDTKGNVTFWSAGMEELTGRTSAAMLSKKAWQGFFEKRAKTPVEMAMRSDEEEIDETFVVTNKQSNEEHQVCFIARPILDEDDELKGIVAQLGEQSQDDQGRQAVDNLNNLPTPVLQIDKEYNVTFMNPAGAGVLGSTPEAVQGKKCYDLFKTAHCNTPECRCAQAMQRDGVFTGETVADPKGLNLPIQYTGSPVKDAQGNIVGALEFVVDISEAKLKLGEIKVLGESQAVIEFEMDGTIIKANDNFLNTLGYALNEIQGQHHSMFVEPEYKASNEYKVFWENLNRGVTQQDEFKRLGKGGKEVWIQASYMPVKDLNGKPFKVVKYAVDVTEKKLESAYYQGQIQGIGESQAVIEFEMDGTIVQANDNFLNTLGYALNEIQGQHHSLFIEPEYKASNEYKVFWDNLNRGRTQQGEFKRLGKGGKEVWIQASYTPIKDLNGKPFKVVKYARDTTKQKLELQSAMGAAQQQADNLNNLPTPITQLDKDFNILSINRAGAAVLGTTQEAAAGKKCYDLFKTPHCNTPECCCAQAMQQDGVFTSETVADPNGLNLPIQYTCSPVKDDQGNIVGALELVVDISERKKVLEDIISVTQQMADANLTVTAQSGYQGDYLKIADSLNQGVKAQHDSMVQVADAVDQIASAADQIASSSQSVAQGASEQASSLEETSSALEEMSSQTKQNADNTQQAKVLTKTTREAAGTGAEAMERMLEAMGKIKKSSEDTSAIIKDINEIAFQTNLLALNAAVEAARAGDAGRGFAVVAEEVRNLALRAKEAANKTESLIAQSTKLANDGGNISGEVSKNLEEITSSVDSVTDIVAEIAAASEEQSKGIDQINKAVLEMDKVVQQSAANAEESSSAAEELASQSQELAAMVGHFELNRNGDGRKATAESHLIERWSSQARPATKKSNGSNGRGSNGEKSRTVAQKLIPLDDDEALFEF